MQGLAREPLHDVAQPPALHRGGQGAAPLQSHGGRALRKEGRAAAQAHQPQPADVHHGASHDEQVAGTGTQGIHLLRLHRTLIRGRAGALSPSYRQDGGREAVHPHSAQEDGRGVVHPPASGGGTDTRPLQHRGRHQARIPDAQPRHDMVRHQ